MIRGYILVALVNLVLREYPTASGRIAVVTRHGYEKEEADAG
jgi:hypothetical protein